MAQTEFDYRIALVGPGQGGQAIGMGKQIAERSKAAMAVWDLTNEVHRETLGYNLTDLVWSKKINGVEVTDEVATEALKQTPLTQSAVYADSISRWIVGTELGLLPKDSFVGFGLSLGRLVADTITGAIDVEDAVRLVKARGDAFYKIKGWLAAFDDVDPSIIEPILATKRQQVGESTIYLSMMNTPVQIVVGGMEASRRDAIQWFTDQDLEVDIDYFWTPVSGPFHTFDMKPAKSDYEEALRKVTIVEPTRGILLGNNGRRLIDPEEDIRPDLLNQVDVTENFLEMGRAAYNMGVTRMICLSGKTTEAGMLKRIGQAKDISKDGVPGKIEFKFPGDENSLLIAPQWTITGKAAQ